MKRRTMKSVLCAALMVLTMSMTACGGADDLEDYLNSTDGAMEAVEEEIAGASQDGMSGSSEVKGYDFTFNFTIVDASLVTDDTTAQLEAGFDATASLFQEMAGQMDDEAGLDKGSVQIIIKYLDPDGKVLAERGFKAQ